MSQTPAQSAVEIVPAEGGAAHKQFITFPWTVYRHDTHWVAPLLLLEKRLFNPRKHSFYEHGEIHPFIARRDGQVVGRIAAITNELYNQHHGVQEGFWGFFECLDDPEAAARLFDHVADWFRRRGITTVYGPMNPSTNHECGLLVDGFDSDPMVMMTYNPSYYVGLVEKYGMPTARNLYAYRVDAPDKLPDKVVNVAKRVKRQGIYKVRPFDFSRYDQEVAELREIYNEAWSDNWGYMPFTEREFAEVAATFRHSAIPELCPVIEHKGRLVAFLLALPDLNQAIKPARGRLFPFGFLKILWYKRKISSLRVVVLGTRKDSWVSGVTACLYHDLITAGVRLGYRWGELSWILEENPVRQIIEMFGATVYKMYRIYQLPV